MTRRGSAGRGSGRPSTPPPTKRAVAVRHVAFEDLGYLEAVLCARGYGVQYMDAGTDDLAGLEGQPPDLLVVLGGPIGAYEDETYPFIRDELKVLEARLVRDLPTLGICLGSQLMARALGARVYPGPRKEIGWAPVTLTAGAVRVDADAGPALAWRYLRSARRDDAARVDRPLREPGVRVGPASAGPPVSRGGDREGPGTLVYRSRV